LCTCNRNQSIAEADAADAVAGAAPEYATSEDGSCACNSNYQYVAGAAAAGAVARVATVGAIAGAASLIGIGPAMVAGSLMAVIIRNAPARPLFATAQAIGADAALRYLNFVVTALVGDAIVEQVAREVINT